MFQITDRQTQEEVVYIRDTEPGLYAIPPLTARGRQSFTQLQKLRHLLQPEMSPSSTLTPAEITAPRLGGAQLSCINAKLALIGFPPDQSASFPSSATARFNSGNRVCRGFFVLLKPGYHCTSGDLQPEVTLNSR